MRYWFMLGCFVVINITVSRIAYNKGVEDGYDRGYDKGNGRGYNSGTIDGYDDGYAVGLTIPNGEKVGPIFDPQCRNSIIVETYEGVCVYSGPGRFEALNMDYPTVVK